mmetsp:Transcript_34466/g.65616  ORF Transcript_34466/g.65616 Transcript_34466/m.65616 type:complete len:291 (+) Transcript_34466:202-1074(+)
MAQQRSMTLVTGPVQPEQPAKTCPTWGKPPRKSSRAPILPSTSHCLSWHSLRSTSSSKCAKKRKNAEVDDFFSNLDGDKFNLKLPSAVDEYYDVKGKCEADGWEPGQVAEGGQPSGHHRQLAQALMKRCIADIPIVSHIQRESAGMNKLYSQSMCSVKQWKSYQAAEAMVSAEVEEVRAEADEIEPGWSQVVWRQAMQYHNMLKQKEEQAKAQQMAQHRAITEKKKAEDDKSAAEKARYDAVKQKVDAEKARIANAEKVADDLVKQEEREKDSQQAFSGKSGGMKKGFLG